MKIHPADQTSAAWMLARLGIPTASQFHRIITPARKEYSKAASAYIDQLIAERIVGMPLDEVSTAAMERGTDLEGDARAWYALTHDAEVVEVGLCLTDDERAGASPDGLVGDDGGLEIKCPGLDKHIGNLRAGEVQTAQLTQVHGGLWVTGRKWWDVVSYHPDAPRQVVQRVRRDPAWIEAFDTHMARFLEELDEAWEQVQAGKTDIEWALARSVEAA